MFGDLGIEDVLQCCANVQLGRHDAHHVTTHRACYVSAMDPLAGSQWSAPDTVAGFATSAANAVLLSFAEQELQDVKAGRLVDADTILRELRSG